MLWLATAMLALTIPSAPVGGAETYRLTSGTGTTRNAAIARASQNAPADARIEVLQCWNPGGGEVSCDIKIHYDPDRAAGPAAKQAAKPIPGPAPSIPAAKLYTYDITKKYGANPLGFDSEEKARAEVQNMRSNYETYDYTKHIFSKGGEKLECKVVRNDIKTRQPFYGCTMTVSYKILSYDPKPAAEPRKKKGGDIAK